MVDINTEKDNPQLIIDSIQGNPNLVNPNAEPGYSDVEIGRQTTEGTIPSMATSPISRNTAEGTTPTDNNSIWNEMSNMDLGVTSGDMIGMIGQLYSTFKPMQNTLANRAGDTPNINAFKDYGKETLKKLDESKQFQNDQRDSALKDLELNRNATIKRGRNSARSVNTLRALDLAADMGVNQTKAAIYNNFAQAMQGIFGAEAAALSDRDAKVMSGEQARDLTDRQDRDNFYTQMGRDIANKGLGIQNIGKTVNDIKTRNVSEKFINQMYNDFEADASTGTINKKTAKDVISQNADYLQSIPDVPTRNKVIGKLESKEWIIKKGKVYNKSTGKVVDITKD